MEKMIKDLVPELVCTDVASIVERQLPWEELDHKTILVTGANGFISYYMVLALLMRNDLMDSGSKVIGLVRSRENAEKKYGEILDREDLSLWVTDVCELTDCGRVDYIIHAASQASAWHFEHDPVGTINANLIGTQKVLELAVKYQAQVLMFSSLKTYGSFGEHPKESMKEEDVGYLDHTSYKNCYAIGKRAAETLCASYSKQYGIPVKIVRPSYIYGPTRRGDDRVWAQFMVNVLNNEDIVLKSSGAPYRSYCYVTDTVAAVFTVLLRGEVMQPYNISSQEGNITIRNLARAAVAAFPEKNLKLSFVNPEDEKEPEITAKVCEILDSEKLEGLGWKAEVSIGEGMKRAIQIMADGE